MKNYNILKWLVSLDPKTMVMALLLIALSALCLELKLDRNKNEITKEKSYEKYVNQERNCDSIITSIRLEYNRKYEDFLKEQIKKLEMNKEKIDETLFKNRLILKKFK